MPGGPPGELPWWESEKQLSLERKAARARAASGVQPGDSFLIVTEGEVTEPVYFKALREHLKLGTVKIVVRTGDTPDPLALGSRALQKERQREAGNLPA
jgi:hypothetical protein